MARKEFNDSQLSVKKNYVVLVECRLEDIDANKDLSSALAENIKEGIRSVVEDNMGINIVNGYVQVELVKEPKKIPSKNK
jgi:hypothetical protein